MGVLGDQMLYGPPIEVAEPPTRKIVKKGYSKKQVEKIAREAALKTEAEWKQYADMLRIQKAALFQTVWAMRRGDIDSCDTKEVENFMSSKAFEIAEKENFDLKAAEKKFNQKQKGDKK
jgi:hypothetical protein